MSYLQIGTPAMYGGHCNPSAQGQACPLWRACRMPRSHGLYRVEILRTDQWVLQQTMVGRAPLVAALGMGNLDTPMPHAIGYVMGRRGQWTAALPCHRKCIVGGRGAYAHVDDAAWALVQHWRQAWTPNVQVKALAEAS